MRPDASLISKQHNAMPRQLFPYEQPQHIVRADLVEASVPDLHADVIGQWHCFKIDNLHVGLLAFRRVTAFVG
jgi:hypothetical protein